MLCACLRCPLCMCGRCSSWMNQQQEWMKHPESRYLKCLCPIANPMNLLGVPRCLSLYSTSADLSLLYFQLCVPYLVGPPRFGTFCGSSALGAWWSLGRTPWRRQTTRQTVPPSSHTGSSSAAAPHSSCARASVTCLACRKHAQMRTPLCAPVPGTCLSWPRSLSCALLQDGGPLAGCALLQTETLLLGVRGWQGSHICCT